MTQTLVVTGDFSFSEHANQLMKKGIRTIHLRGSYQYDDLRKALSCADSYIVGGPEYVSADLLNTAQQLRHIIVLGTGTPSFVDLAAATDRAIKVENTPHLNIDAVVEFAIGSALACLSGFVWSVEGVRMGTHWVNEPRRSLRDITWGIVGLGHIGEALARKLKLFDVDILYWNRQRKRSTESGIGIKYLDLEDLLAASDVITLHLAYTKDTHNFIGAQALKKAKPTAMLMNFGNPHLVCPTALRNALLRDQLKFGFVDGYYQEWNANSGMADDPWKLLSLPANKFLASSHIAAQESGAVQATLKNALQKLLQNLHSE